MFAKTSFAAVLALVLAAPALAQPVPPRPSPGAKVEQTVGLSKITVSYSRPGAKGRQIFGGLVPWGEVWRTGANEATLFEISHDAMIDGQKLAAGKYAFFTIPKQDSWTLVFNKQAEQWGAYNYQKDQDALRLEAKPRAIPHEERFEIRFAEVDEKAARIELRWAEVMVPFNVTFDTNELALSEIRAYAAKAAGADGVRPLTGWANWAMQNGLALNEAEGWAGKASAEIDSYRVHALYARLLAKNGKVKEANAAADKALARAAGADAEVAGVKDDAAKLRQEKASWK